MADEDANNYAKSLGYLAAIVAGFLISLNQGLDVAQTAGLIKRTPIPTLPTSESAIRERDQWERRGNIIDSLPEQVTVLANGVTDAGLALKIMQRTMDDVRRDLREIRAEQALYNRTHKDKQE